jgi:chromosomal replication initiation ATPase DnaA
MSMMTLSYRNNIQKDLKRALADIKDVTGVKPKDVLSRLRTADVSTARHLAFYLLRSLHHPYSKIAKAMNRSDHGTVVHGVNSIKNYAMIERKMAARMKALRKKGYDI